MAERALAEAYVKIAPSFTDKSLKAELGKLSGITKTVGKESGAGFTDGFGSTVLGGLKKLAGPIAAAVSVGALANFAKQSVQAAQEISGGLREVVTLTGLTGTEADTAFEEFRKGIAGVSTELGLAQEVLVEGLYNALSAGVPRENAFTFLEAAGKAAVAGVTDTNTAVDGLTTVINAFGLETSQVSEVSDSLFAAVQGGKTTFQELADSLFNVGPAASAAGVSFQEVNAAIATLTAGGTPTSVATTQIRAALVGLQRPSEELDSIFQALGFDNAQLAIESKGLGFALDAVKDASNGSNGTLQQLLGSVEAVAAANVLAGTGSDKFTEELERQAGAAGATDKAFEEVDKSRSLERLGIVFKNIAIQVGTVLLPLIEDIAQKLTAFLQDAQPEIDAFIAEFKEGKTPLNDFFTAIGDALSFLINNFEVIKNVTIAVGGLIIVIQTINGVLAIARTAMLLLNLAFAANPVGLVITAIAALVAGLVYFFTQTETGRQAWATFVEFLGTTITAFAEGFKLIIENIKIAWTNTINAITTFFTTAWQSAVELFQTIITNIRTAFETTWNNITAFFKGIINTYIGLWEGFINFFINGINFLINGINKIKIDIPEWLQGLSGGATSIGFNIPNLSKISIPRLAEGGLVMPQQNGVLANIAEAGQPEVVYPLDRFERLLENRQPQNSGDTINYYNYASPAISNEAELERAIKRARLRTP